MIKNYSVFYSIVKKECDPLMCDGGFNIVNEVIKGFGIDVMKATRFFVNHAMNCDCDVAIYGNPENNKKVAEDFDSEFINNVRKQ